MPDDHPPPRSARADAAAAPVARDPQPDLTFCATALRAPINALLFDIGEVVIRIDWRGAMAVWAEAANVDANQLAARFTAGDAYCAFERDEIDATTFYAALRQQLAIDIDDATLQAGWNAIFAGLQQPVIEAIRHWRQRLPVYAFSNTNRVHRRHFMALYAEEMGLFKHFFDSSEIRARKPEARAFAHVVAAIGVPAEQVLFFDDLPVNVAGARAAGLQAVVVRHPDDVLTTLAQLPPRN